MNEELCTLRKKTSPRRGEGRNVEFWSSKERRANASPTEQTGNIYHAKRTKVLRKILKKFRKRIFLEIKEQTKWIAVAGISGKLKFTAFPDIKRHRREEIKTINQLTQQKKKRGGGRKSGTSLFRYERGDHKLREKKKSHIYEKEQTFGGRRAYPLYSCRRLEPADVQQEVEKKGEKGEPGRWAKCRRRSRLRSRGIKKRKQHLR